MSQGANENMDDDNLFLDHVLNKLYDFGNGTSKKKKKRKRCVEEEEETVALTAVCENTEDVRLQAHEESAKAQKTAAQKTDTQTLTQVEVVTFHDPSKKARTKEALAPPKQPAPQIKEKKFKEKKDRPEELLFEKTRVEVHRFGITGYKKEQQRSFEQDRAIMLGARPPKKEYVNYKVLQQQIKDKKEEIQADGQDNKKKKKKRLQSRDQKKTPTGSGTLGQVGRFKNGILMLSSKELERIKGSRGGK